MKILVVDDEVISRKKLLAILGKYAECEMASSGEQALEMFQKSLDAGAPYKLITMDVLMPGISGKETVEKIRKIEADRGINSMDDSVKILMISASDDGKTIFTSFRKGCEAYLVKPFDADSILQKLDEMSCYF